ncbi:MAG: hypothetical protein NUV50_03550 [Rhodospirillales bacterium]|nr:hypothetical protein [Rhodospirillales bacterium]
MFKVMFKFPFIYKLALPLLALWVALVMAPASASAASPAADSFVDHRAHMASVAQPCEDQAAPTCAPTHPLPGCALACSALPAGALFALPALSLQVSALADAAPQPDPSLLRAGRSLSPEPFPPRFASSL